MTQTVDTSGAPDSADATSPADPGTSAAADSSTAATANASADNGSSTSSADGSSTPAADGGSPAAQTSTAAASPATVPGGWADAPAGGENAAGQIVAGLRRIPIDGLSSVNAEVASDPHALESAAGRAIAVLPATVDVAQAVEILLHLHGFNIGYRQRSAVAGNTDPGTVRDKVQDQIESQVTGSGRTMIALLPQGTVHSGFGPSGGRFACDDFITEALAKLVSLGALSAVPSITRVVLSAHSGGGGAVATMLQEASQPRLPSTLGALFYFEAINGTIELSAARTWLGAKLDADLKALQALTSAADQAAYLATSFRFRGFYFSQDDFYVPNYTGLKAALDAWFNANAAALGGSGGPNFQALAVNYQIIVPAPFVGHDKMVGANLQTALAALP
jgi:hypothetical protein